MKEAARAIALLLIARKVKPVRFGMYKLYKRGWSNPDYNGRGGPYLRTNGIIYRGSRMGRWPERSPVRGNDMHTILAMLIALAARYDLPRELRNSIPQKPYAGLTSSIAKVQVVDQLGRPVF